MNGTDVVRSAVQSTLMASMWPAARAFRRAVENPLEAQHRALQRVLRSVTDTVVARRHPQLTAINHPADLRNVAPLTTYDDIADDMTSMANGAVGVRTNGRVVRFERSGGSSGVQKLLPMTDAFLADMQRGIAPWLFDLYRGHPALLSTSAYWSISPIGAKALPTAAGIPVGSDDDSAYLPPPLRALMRQVMVTSPALAQFPDVDSCRYATIRLLLGRPDLGLISVWSPTFLSLLLDALSTHVERLLDDLAAGTCRIPGGDAAVDALASSLPLTADPTRADLLRRSLRRAGTLSATEIWPRLEVVSLWRDGESARFALDVERRLTGVGLQAKGLLATEGIVTIPFAGAGAPVLCVDSHVYEFLLDDGRVALAHELTDGTEAEVVLSTTAGLLRYRLGDRVRVEGFVGQTPCLRFLGRTGTVSDLVGEKLSGDLVTSVFDDVSAIVARPSFALLAPRRQAPLRYTLYLDGLSEDRAIRFGDAVERAFCEGHPYRYARDLGQLAAIEVIRVHDAMPRYEAWRIDRGQRAGDIKYPALCLDEGCHAALWDGEVGPDHLEVM